MATSIGCGPMINVIQILGTTFCGSTALSYMLGNHEDSVTVGELYSIFKRKNCRCISCNTKIENCKLCKSIKESNVDDVYRVVSEFTGKDFIIDSSKFPAWYEKLNGDYYNKTKIFLYKNPIRFAASCVKHRVRSVSFGVTVGKDERIIDNVPIWSKSLEYAINVFKRNIPRLLGLNPIVIIYEDFAKEPENTVKRICDMSGFPYRDGMHRFWENTHHHNIGGNIGANYFMNDIYKIGSDSIYKDNYKEIFVDNSYKRYLNDDDIKLLCENEDIVDTVNAVSKYTGVSFDKLMFGEYYEE